MAKSQQTFSKKEREKKRRKKKQEKRERREQRKLEKEQHGPKSFEEMLSYVDENGNLTSTPPDPSKKKKIKAEDIELGVPSRNLSPEERTRKGKVKFFNHEKGYGFITDAITKDSVFVHVNDVTGEVKDNANVTFEMERGPKGFKAVNVHIVKT